MIWIFIILIGIQFFIFFSFTIIILNFNQKIKKIQFDHNKLEERFKGHAHTCCIAKIKNIQKKENIEGYE